jgi:N6-adenosine-specific RNA methylase IME4
MADTVELIPPEVGNAADYIASAWRQGVESIIETGRRLIEIREQFKDDRGKWSQLVGRDQWKGRGLLPFGKTHAQRLIAIAGDERFVPHVGRLPSDSYTLHKLTQLSPERFDELIEAGRIHPGMKRNEASAETRRERRSGDEERILSIEPRPGRYRTLVADPPWDYEWLSLAGRAAPGYATMSREELLELDVAQWAEDDCHLYLWTTNNFMTRAVELMARWGFQHKTVLTWVKPRWGLGSYFRNSTEHVLFGVRGELRTRSDSIATHFEAPVGEHSEKPDRFYEIVAEASYLPAGEIFQRKPREGFIDCYQTKLEAAE